MCKPVDQGISQDLVLDDLSPAVEGQVCGDDGGLCIGSEREMIEEQLTALLVAGHVSKLIADDKVVALSDSSHMQLSGRCFVRNEIHIGMSSQSSCS